MDDNSTYESDQNNEEEPNNNACIASTVGFNGDQNNTADSNLADLQKWKEEVSNQTAPSDVMDNGNNIIQGKTEMQPIEIPATSMSQKRFQCRLCTLNFSKRWNCLSHMRAHTRVRHVYHCPTCRKKCSKQSELEIHMRIHTGEKPHVCPVCQRGFVRRGQLNAHSRIHTGDKPHMCDDCGAFFASSSNLRRHQQCHAKARGVEGGVRRAKIHIVRREKSRLGGPGGKGERQAGGRAGEEAWSKPGPFPTRVFINRHNTPTLHNIAASQLQQSQQQQQQPSGDFNSSSVATNTDCGIITNTVPSQVDQLKSETLEADAEAVGSSQVIPVPIKAIPAMLVDPVMEELLEEKKISITEETLQGGEHKMEQALVTANSTGAVQVVAEALAQGEVTGGEGQITLVTEAEPSAGALSSVMQMDWSFLLEDTGPATTLETLSEPLPQSQAVLSLAGAVPGVDSTETHLPDPSSVGHSAAHTVNNSVAQDGSMSYQLSIPADAALVAGSTGFEVNSSTVTVESPVFQLNGSCLPLIVPIPHIPAVDSSQPQPGEEVSESEHHTMASSGPITLVVEQLHPDHYQVVQEIPANSSCTDATQLVLDGQGFSQPHTITLLPHTTFINTPTSGNPPSNNPTTDNPTNSSPPVDNPCLPPAPSSGAPTSPSAVKTAAAKSPAAKPFVCDVCKQRFSRQWYLTVHRTTHFRPDTFPCNQCSAQFSRLGNLNRHKRSHTGAKPFQCSTCPSRFGSKYRLIEHERRHKGYKPYMCETCNCCFSDCSSLKRHQQAHKGDNLQHTCEFCGAQFRTLHSLSFHMRMHDSEASSDKGITLDESESTPRDMPIVPVNQSQVYEAAKQMPCVLKQMALTGQGTTTSYLCSVCRKSFLHSAACRQHILCHTGSRPFKCTDCGAKFSRKADAKRHTLTHRREKRHLCATCGDKFQTLSRLVLHQEMHRPAHERSFPCQECGESFSKERVVRIHAQFHHHHRRRRYHQNPSMGEEGGVGEEAKKTSSDVEEGARENTLSSNQDTENQESGASTNRGKHKSEGEVLPSKVDDGKAPAGTRQDPRKENGRTIVTGVGEKRSGRMGRDLTGAKAEEGRTSTANRWSKDKEGGISPSSGSPNPGSTSIETPRGEKRRKMTVTGKMLTVGADKKPKMLSIVGTAKQRTLTVKTEERGSKVTSLGNKKGWSGKRNKPTAHAEERYSIMRSAGSSTQRKERGRLSKGRGANGATPKMSKRGTGKCNVRSRESSRKRSSYDFERSGLQHSVQVQSNSSTQNDYSESIAGCNEDKSKAETNGNGNLETNTHENKQSNSDVLGNGKSNTNARVNRIKRQRQRTQNLLEDNEQGLCVDEGLEVLVKRNTDHTQSIILIHHNTATSEQQVSTSHIASRDKQIIRNRSLLISKQPNTKSYDDALIIEQQQVSTDHSKSQNEQPIKASLSVLLNKQPVTADDCTLHNGQPVTNNSTKIPIDQPVTTNSSAICSEKPVIQATLSDAMRPLRAAAKKQRKLLALLAPKQRVRKKTQLAKSVV